jgi:hypothetical protein
MELQEHTRDAIQIAENDIEYGKMLAPLLVTMVGDGLARLLPTMSIPIFINDILGHLLRFRQCRDALEKLGIDQFPCQVFEDQSVPLDWLEVSGELYASHPKEVLDLREPWYRVQPLREFFGRPVEEIPFKTAVGLVVSSLKELVAVRSAMRERPPNSKCGGSVDLTIKTSMTGLEISYTPFWYVKWTQFGYPTSPVNNCIQPSDYYFRARQYVGGKFADKYVDNTRRPIHFPTQTEQLPV